MKPNFAKGLIPAVVIEEDTKEVLMLAYMNEEAYDKTLETKEHGFIPVRDNRYGIKEVHREMSNMCNHFI